MEKDLNLSVVPVKARFIPMGVGVLDRVLREVCIPSA